MRTNLPAELFWAVWLMESNTRKGRGQDAPGLVKKLLTTGQCTQEDVDRATRLIKSVLQADVDVVAVVANIDLVVAKAATPKTETTTPTREWTWDDLYNSKVEVYTLEMPEEETDES